jgi:hypothetical protein
MDSYGVIQSKLQLKTDILSMSVGSMKKPPDQVFSYKTIKTSLNAILVVPDNVIQQTVDDVNYLVGNAYQFIRLHQLYHFNQDLQLPHITKKYIQDVFRILGFKTTCGAKLKNSMEVEELKQFHQEHFLPTFKAASKNFRTVSLVKRTQILDYQADQMLVGYSNNLKLHFFKRILKTLRMIWPDRKKETKQYVDFLCSSSEISDLPEEFECFLWFHLGLEDNLPETINISLPYHVEAHPMDFLQATLWINQQRELCHLKLFQPLPLRTSLVPAHITIDTSSLIDLFVAADITKYKRHITLYADELWSTYFNIDSRKFRCKDYIFANIIQTNGFNASILFKRIVKKMDKPQATHQATSQPTCQATSQATVVGCDPGKGNLLYMSDDKNKLRYTAAQRRFESYGTRSAEITKIERDKAGITQIESTLCNFNSKTCYLDIFKEYLTQKHVVDAHVRPFYEKMLFRKLKWRRYVHTQQSEQAFIQRIRDTFGPCVIALGDWSGNNALKHQPPTANKRINRLLVQNFPVQKVCEYKTSVTCHRCYGTTECFLRRARSPKDDREILVTHLLRCKTCSMLWHRDLNASLNIRSIYLNAQTNDELPEPFRRRRVLQCGSSDVGCKPIDISKVDVSTV